MNRNQYKRVNTMLLPALMIIYAYIIMSLWSANSRHLDSSKMIFLQLAVTIVGIVASILFFIIWGQNRIGSMALLISSLVVYLVIRLSGTLEEAWIYAFPILIASMTHLDQKIVIVGNSIVVLSNVVYLLMHLDQLKGETGNTIYVSIVFSLVVSLVCFFVTKLLVSFNRENTKSIQEATARQEASNQKMAGIAEEVLKHFEDAMKMMEVLKESLDNSNFSIKNIADSTELTAESIQTQAEMCAKIGQQTEHAGEVTNKMMHSSRQVDDSVDAVMKDVRELKIQASNVEQVSKTTVDMVHNLTEKVKDVENFVDTILSISNQTNLLALNASIEAARAGESGRGFAVVAEEIRVLSEQTKSASNHITTIIQELDTDTSRANESIDNSMKYVMIQNRLIEDTREKFEKIAEEIVHLTRGVKSTEETMQEIIQSSGVISENILQLSATSEEVAASSNESMKQSEITVEEVEKCKSIFESIYELTKDLNQI